MSQVRKLYKYYLKKSLWRSWRIWYVILFCWVWWILWPIVFSSLVKNKLQIERTDGKAFSKEEEEETRKFYTEEFSGFKNIVGKSYTGVHLVDKENAEWWEKQAEKATDNKKRFDYKNISNNIKARLAKKKDEKREISDEEKWLGKYQHSSGLQYPLGGSSVWSNPFDYQYIALSSGRQQEVGTSQFWHVINFVSLGNMGGVVLAIFLVYNLVDYLFVQPKKSGEEATVLIFAPSVKRSELFISKSLAYITALSCYAWLAFVLPYTIFLLLGPGIISWSAYLSLVFWITIIGPILFFLFPISLYLFTSGLGIIGIIIHYLLSYFFLVWNMIKAMVILAGGREGSFPPVIAKMEYWYFHPYVYVPLALVLGGLLLYLSFSYYQEEDLG